MSEAMAGRVDFFCDRVALVLPQIRDGKLVPLAVNGAKRSAALADVPTTAEAGFMDAECPIWFGLFVPASTSREVIEKLNRETLKAQGAEIAGKACQPWCRSDGHEPDRVRVSCSTGTRNEHHVGEGGRHQA